MIPRGRVLSKLDGVSRQERTGYCPCFPEVWEGSSDQ